MEYYDELNCIYSNALNTLTEICFGNPKAEAHVLVLSDLQYGHCKALIIIITVEYKLYFYS